MSLPEVGDWSQLPLSGVVRSDAPIGYGIVQVGSNVPDGVPVIAIRDLPRPSKGKVHRSSLAIEVAYRRSRVIPGDVLVSVKGTTGRVGIVPEGFHGNISRDVARIRLGIDHDPNFWFQLLQSPRAQKTIQQSVVGTTRQELSIGTLTNLKFCFPDKGTQEQIASALTDTDDLIASLERLIAKKRAIKKGMMQELLAGQTRMPGFHEPWSATTLGEISRIKTGSRNNQDKQSSGQYPFFVRSAMVERIDSYSYDCEAILVPGEGALARSFTTSTGRSRSINVFTRSVTSSAESLGSSSSMS